MLDRPPAIAVAARLRSDIERLGPLRFAALFALLLTSAGWLAGGLGTSWWWHPPGLVNSGGSAIPEDFQLGVTSLMDTWLLLRNVEFNGERNRMIYVLKSRGMAHSNELREFALTDRGLHMHSGPAEPLAPSGAWLVEEGQDRHAIV